MVIDPDPHEEKISRFLMDTALSGVKCLKICKALIDHFRIGAMP